MRRILYAGLTISFITLAPLIGGGAGFGNGAAIAIALQTPSARREFRHLQSQTALTKEVRHELMLLPRYSLFDWLEFEVNPNGIVTLRGQVVGPTLKADAENAVKRIEGVTGVVNQIENLPSSPSDEQIRRAAYRVIYAEDGPLFRYALNVVPSIHIIVKNGNLTLKGVVDSQSDSDFANIKARGVPGVLDVKNELSVEKR
jgi:hyperosmotically inducible periplasmic protein